jgi:acid phosphatase type 7
MSHYTSNSKFWATICLGMLAMTSWLLAHPNHDERGLLLHLVASGHPIKNETVADETHNITAKLIGKPKVVTLGPTEAFAFDGKQDYLLLSDKIDEVKKVLPVKEMTVMAWVNLQNIDQEWGGIVGAFQDNGNSEQGWVLGYNDGRFMFGLASQGANDGDGNMTYLRAKDSIETGRWYHVVATYDGQLLRLFINGKLANESKAQSGDILYPTKAQYVVGGYIDQDEKFLLNGAVREVKLYSRVIPETELQQLVTKNQNLLDFQGPVSGELRFVVTPYLQAGSTTSMSIMCETNHPSQMLVEYGRQVPLTERIVSKSNARINRVNLNNLEPGMQYFYRVTCSAGTGTIPVTSELLSLQTDRGPTQAWSFGIIGDTQRNPEITRKCAEGIYSHRPNMVIHCGDVVDDGYAKNQWIKDLFEPMAKLNGRVPLFPTIGNHEKNSHWYYDYFHLPEPEYYYTFTYGNAQFFMIDSNKSLKPDSEQYVWLEKQLKQSKATWKFTCHHHPCFSSDENDYGDHVKGEYKRPATWGDPNAQQLVPLYEKYGIDIAFNGHVHIYERTWPIMQMAINQQRGVRYITSGGGGGGLEDAAPQRTWFMHHFKRAYHYCTATIHDRTIQFKAYDIEDRLFDTFELTKPAGR